MVTNLSGPVQSLTKIYCRESSVRKKRLAIMENQFFTTVRNSPTELFFGKGVLKICSKFKGEHPCRSYFDGCSPVNLLHIFRITFHKNTSGGMLLSNESYAEINDFRGNFNIYYHIIIQINSNRSKYI